MALSGSSFNMGKQGVYNLSHNDDFEFYTSKLNSSLQYLLKLIENNTINSMRIVEYDVHPTIPANSGIYEEITLSNIIPSDMKGIGVVGFWNRNYVACAVTDCEIAPKTQNLTYAIRNYTGSEVNGHVSFKILCAPISSIKLF